MEITVTAVMTTLGRSTLQRALDSIEQQSMKPVKVIIKNGPGDTVTKMNEALQEIDTEVLVWLDDDAVYPMEWLKSLAGVFVDDEVGYAAGTCLPLTELDNASNAEKCIAEVTSTFFGTTNMSQRHKIGKTIQDRDETNLMGSGMYRTSVMKKIFAEEFVRIPPGFSETYIIYRMRQMGQKTLYVPGGFFYHKQRSNIVSFARQIFRSGVGRMNFFKQFPSQALTKFYIFIPSAFLLYLIAFFGLAIFANYGITNLPLLIYVVALLFMSFGFNKHKSRWLWLYYLTMHLSYGVGMLVGLFKNYRTWK